MAHGLIRRSVEPFPFEGPHEISFWRGAKKPHGRLPRPHVDLLHLVGGDADIRLAPAREEDRQARANRQVDVGGFA